MYKYKNLKTCLLLMCAMACHWLMPGASYAEPEAWRLAIDQEGIKVYKRMREGSSIAEVKAVSVVEAPFDFVVALYEDDSKYEDWCYQCRELYVIKRINPMEKIVYYETELPWPFANRDSISHHQKVIDPETRAVTYLITDASQGYPPKEGIVRITDFAGLWRLTPLSGGRVELYFQQYANIAGKAPQWLVNQFATDVPFYSQRSFRRLLYELLKGGKPA